MQRAIVTFFAAGMMVAGGLAATAGCGSAINITARDATPDTPPPTAELRGTDQNGAEVDLEAIASTQPTLLVFYRGHW